jgi:YVTN family beta-propeller protein
MKTRTLALIIMLGILLFGSLGFSGTERTILRMPNDPDGDGVPDPLDLCPLVNASFFDRNGDGCIDDPVGARHTEYWAASQMPFTYYINENGAPGITNGSDFTALQSAMSAWTAIPGVDFTVNYGGTSSQAIAAALDQVNLITFSDNQYKFSASVLAVGISTSFTVDSLYNGTQYRPGQIVDADMIFNPVKIFRTPTEGVQGTDIQSVATHEAGHLFGIAHSPVRTSTLFYVLPPGTSATSLEMEDELVFFKAYPSSAALAGASRLEGSVSDGSTNGPVPGAIVYAIDASSGDTVAADYTMPDGGFCFIGLPDGDYYVAIHALDGSSTIGYLTPSYINSLVDTTAVEAFVAEHWDLAESNGDDPAAKAAVRVAAGSTSGGIDILTNTDSTPPTVVRMTPAANSDSVKVDAVVMITFSEPIDDASVESSFKLRDDVSGTFLNGTAVILKDDSVIAFTPSQPFNYEHGYTLNLTTGLTDEYGNGLAQPFISAFTTEITPPLDITSLAPSKGVVGSIVVVNGVGFAEDPVDNQVFFGSIQAAVLDAYPMRLIVLVPHGATSDLVTVTVGGMTSDGITFTVLSDEEIARGFRSGITSLGAAPRALAMLPGGEYGYVATDAGACAVVTDPGLAGYLTVTSIPVAGGFDAIAAVPDGKRVYAVSKLNRKLYTIDGDRSHGLLFNTVISEHQIGGEPIGIVIDPGGRRAYIAVSAGEVQIWDVAYGSETFERQVGVIYLAGESPRGGMAFDPTGEKLLVASGAGKLLVFDAGPDTLLARVSVLNDPRDVAVDPVGQRAYVSDGTGNISIISLTGLFKVQDINTGGSLRGMTLTPAGMFLYAINRELNLIDVIDLRESSGTFRSVVATIAQEVNPIDIALSPDGFYAFSVAESGRRFTVTTIGLGPTLKSLSRRAGPPGTKLVLAGSGFGTILEDLNVEFAPDFGQPGPIAVAPEYSSGTSLIVTVPPEAGNGPVRIVRTRIAEPPQLSNALYFQVLEPSGPGQLRLAARTATPGGYDLFPGLAISPTGDFLVVGGDDPETEGVIGIYDIDPESAMFNQFLGTSEVSSTGPEKIVITPDGERAYVVIPGSERIRCMDVNRYSGSFGNSLGEIDLTGVAGTEVVDMAISPSGETLLLAADTSGGYNFLAVDIVPGSANENVVVGSRLDPFVTLDIEFHPSGRYAYLANFSNSAIAVLCTDPLDSRYFQIVGSVSVMAGPWGRAPQSLSFTPDGSHCIALSFRKETYAWESLNLDTTDPENPVLVDAVNICGNDLMALGAIDVSPRGDRALAAIGRCGYFSIDLTADPDTIMNGLLDNSAYTTIDMDFTPDGSRVYVSAPLPDSIYIYDFNAANRIQFASGNYQSGTVGEPLPVPIRALVAESGTVTLPVAGVPVTFTVVSGGGHFTDSGISTQVVATNQAGLASIDWTLGGATGTQTVEAEAMGLAGSPLTFIAVAYDDPDSLPLRIVQTIPLHAAPSVSVTTAVQGVFSRAVDPLSIADTTFFLIDALGTAPTAATVGFSDGNQRVSLMPLQALEYSTLYNIIARASIRDGDGEALENPLITSFITVAKPPLVLTSVTPPSAAAGASIVLSGFGIDPLAADNRVLWSGAEGVPFAASVDCFKIKVPLGAISGSVRIVSGGDTSNAMPFNVLIPSTSPIDEVIATVGTGSSSKSVAVTPDGAIAYTASPDGDAVVPIDVDEQTSYPSIAVGDDPVAIAINPEGTYAYVVNFGSGSVSVIVVDPDSTTFNSVVQTILVGTNPIDVAVNPDGDRIYVANAGSSNLSVIDGDNASATHHQVVATVSTGSSAKSVAVTPDGTRIYVGTDAGYVIVDPLSNAVTAPVSTGSSTKSVAVTPDGALLIVLTTGGDVLIVDVQAGSPTENQVVGTISSGSSTKSVAVSPDGALLYVILEGSDEAIVYSLAILGSASVLVPGVIIPPTVVQVTSIDTIPTGEDPAEIAFDPSGSGFAIICNAGDKTVTILNASSVPAGPLSAEVRVTPRALNLRSHGRWVQGRIELPVGYWPEEIDVGGVRLQDAIPVVPGMFVLGEDEDQDGLRELVVKFDRATFQAILPQGEYVPVTISGTARNRPFLGVDTIRTIRPVVIHPKGEALTMDQMTNIVWTSPKGFSVDSVSIDWTPNDGRDWCQIARRIPDSHSYPWHVPAVMFDSCRVMITLWASSDILGQGMSQDMFMISVPVAVTVESFSGAFEDEAAVLRWSTLLEQNLDGFNVLRSENEEGGYECITPTPLPAGGSAGGGSYEFKDPDVGLNRTYFYKLEGVSGTRSQEILGPHKIVCRAPFALAQNAPNPFNPSTDIKFTIAEDSYVTLAVYDVAGRRVKTLVDRSLKANFYRAEWDGRNDEGRKVTSGMYFYRLQAGAFVQSRKMILLR